SAVLFVAACKSSEPKATPAPCPPATSSMTTTAPAATDADKPVAASVIADAKAKLLAKHGDAHKAAIARGVDQVAKLWRESDGDLAAFCLEQFLPEQAGRDKLFERLQEINEQIRGHFLELG